MNLKIIEKVVYTLKQVDGVCCVVLGGSNATGSAGKHSDIDIGVYYSKSRPLNILQMNELFSLIDDEHRNDAINDIGAWGKWINGGGWLKIDGVPVDILFREIEQVKSVVNDCLNGDITIEYQSGHPAGFVNSIYLGELAECKILYSADDTLEKMKLAVEIFPQKYKDAAINHFLWEAEFSLLCGKKSVAKCDVLYASLSLSRCSYSLIQVLFAVNDMYLLNEKGSLARLKDKTDVKIPQGFCEKVKNILANMSENNLDNNFTDMQNLIISVKDIAAK